MKKMPQCQNQKGFEICRRDTDFNRPRTEAERRLQSEIDDFDDEQRQIFHAIIDTGTVKQLRLMGKRKAIPQAQTNAKTDGRVNCEVFESINETQHAAGAEDRDQESRGTNVTSQMGRRHPR